MQEQKLVLTTTVTPEFFDLVEAHRARLKSEWGLDVSLASTMRALILRGLKAEEAAR